MILLVCAILVQEDPWTRIGPLFEAPAELRDNLGTHRPVLRFEDGRPVTTPAEWAERRGEITRKWTEVLGPWPEKIEKPAWDRLFQEKVEEDLYRLRMEIEIAPGRKTLAWLLIPTGGGKRPAVIDVFYYPEDGAGMKTDRRLQNDFGYQMAKRGFVALCIGQYPTAPKPNADLYWPTHDAAKLQPLSYLAYVADTARRYLESRDEVDPLRIGIVGHSYGGKWALFAGALSERFAAVAVSDPGIVFDEKRGNVNYWEPWYLGYEAGKPVRQRGLITDKFPRVGAYKTIVEKGMDLHELHALICPRPFFVSGGAEDPVSRWTALNHSVAVNRLLGVEKRVGMSLRPEHKISPEASSQIADFFVHFLGGKR